MIKAQRIILMGMTLVTAACADHENGSDAQTIDCRASGNECPEGFVCTASRTLGNGFECMSNAPVAADQQTTPMATADSEEAAEGLSETTLSAEMRPAAALSADSASECAGILNCVNGPCAAAPTAEQEACLVDCIVDASPMAQAAFANLNQCITTNCITTAGRLDQACIAMQCAEEVEECTPSNGSDSDAVGGPTPMGTGACTDLDECAVACGDNESCALDCVAELSPEAWALYNELLACSRREACSTRGSQIAAATCILTACRDEFHRCQMDTITLGANSCGELYDCNTDCAFDDASCRRQCRDQGSMTANDLLTDYLICIQTDVSAVMCADTTCQEAACADALTACQNTME